MKHLSLGKVGPFTTQQGLFSPYFYSTLFLFILPFSLLIISLVKTSQKTPKKPPEKQPQIPQKQTTPPPNSTEKKLGDPRRLNVHTHQSTQMLPLQVCNKAPQHKNLLRETLALGPVLRQERHHNKQVVQIYFLESALPLLLPV